MSKVPQMNQKNRKEIVKTPSVQEKIIFSSFLWKGNQEYFIKVLKIINEFTE